MVYGNCNIVHTIDLYRKVH